MFVSGFNMKDKEKKANTLFEGSRGESCGAMPKYRHHFFPAKRSPLHHAAGSSAERWPEEESMLHEKRSEN